MSVQIDVYDIQMQLIVLVQLLLVVHVYDILIQIIFPFVPII